MTVSQDFILLPSKHSPFVSTPPILPELTNSVSQERLAELRARNATMKKIRVEYSNTRKDGFVPHDPKLEDKRQLAISFYESKQDEFNLSAGEKTHAFFFKTGFIDFFGKLFSGNLYSETHERPFSPSLPNAGRSLLA